ncbi:MAG: hypothetical protein Q7I97_04985, partial [Thermovirgaceae bacterium]|nr:hypothetical protein [Thermovirgaceae bacterium]
DAAPDEEKVAFRFAGAFLAPKPLVISDFGKRERLPDHEELLLLKKRYGLSMQAIIRRLYDLGLISGSTYTTANIQMNRAGFKKKEPLDDDIKPETSTLSRLRALRALRDGIIPEDEFYLFVGESDPGSVNRVEIFSGFSGTPRRKLDSGDIDKLNVFFNSMESKEWEEMGIAR